MEAAASTDQDRRYEQARARRFLRHRALSDVEGLIEMRGPIDQTARVMAALGPVGEGAVRDRPGRPSGASSPDAMAFDAMVDLADDAAAGRFTEAPSPGTGDGRGAGRQDRLRPRRDRAGRDL